MKELTPAALPPALRRALVAAQNAHHCTGADYPATIELTHRGTEWRAERDYSTRGLSYRITARRSSIATGAASERTFHTCPWSRDEVRARW